MDKETKIILAIGILIIAFIDFTRFVWTATAYHYGDRGADQKIACLEGGGEVVEDGFGTYQGCTSKK